MTAGRRRGRAGIAYLVGAGPGDPGLLTVRGRELLDGADAVVYDALANPALLPPGIRASGARVELFDVGKRGGDAGGSERQEKINDLLVKLVRQGKRVVRLKGGDPFVFGRGGEEAQALREAGLAFEIVPGVTAGIAAAAYAGIPVTHRGLSTSVTLVTGHEAPEKGVPGVDWQALARSGGTIVLYMSVRKLEGIARQLIAGGLPPETPTATIEWGTHPRQRTLEATLDTIAAAAAAAGFAAPCVTVVGWTVVLRDELAWFDQRPLFGVRILVARTGDSLGTTRLGSSLRDLGAQVFEIAATRVVPLDPSGIRSRIERLHEYEWIIFTSRNAVALFWRELERAGKDARDLCGARVCVVGPATAAELKAHGVTPDIRPRRFVAEGLLEELRARDGISGSKVLYACAEGARDVLRVGLEALGAAVDRVHLYSSVADGDSAAALRDAVAGNELDLVVFTSASAVRAFASAMGEERTRVPAASLGPITSAALREHGLEVAVEAAESTVDSLVQSIAVAFANPEDDMLEDARRGADTLNTSAGDDGD